MATIAAGSTASPEWGGAAASSARAPRASALDVTSSGVTARGSQPAPADVRDVDITIEPSDVHDDERELAALRDEARGRGRLTLRDGMVISGRLVAEELVIEPGATIFIAGDTEIAALGNGVFDATFLPLPGAASEEDDPVASDESDLDADSTLQPSTDVQAAQALAGAPTQPPGGPLEPGCAGVASATGTRGKRAPKVHMQLAGEWVFNGMPVPVCAGPLAVQQPVPLDQLVIGARSAKARGGGGGHGARVTIRALGNATLTIAGELCNGRGADGADATAVGLDGPACECGGDAYAIGGRGGDAGSLSVSAAHIVWDMTLASLTVQPGGRGGDATAIAGQGGDCDQCGVEGGRGGHASAVAGNSGRNGRIVVRAFQTMAPAPQVVLASGIVTFVTAPDGGAASAEAGDGGIGGDCFDCALDGGRGGAAGSAYARAAEGAGGMILGASANNAVKAYYGSDAGDGGVASARAGHGGDGGLGGDCLCSDPLQAGRGGPGGNGGGAKALGGQGGGAKGGKPALALNLPVAGDGGDAIVACGFGGWGGAGGWCLLDTPEHCTPGSGGAAGVGGVLFAKGGKRGPKDAAAIAGVDGDPSPAITSTCVDGLPGVPGQKDCPSDRDGDCCVPGNAPGCEDATCAMLVCEVNPLCCDLQWDIGCAEIASILCRICEPGGVR